MPLEVQVHDAAGERLDVFLARTFPAYSRGYFQKLIKRDLVTVNGKTVTPHIALKEHDHILVTHEERTAACIPESRDLAIIHEDGDVILVNKSAGMVVHPACGHAAGTLLNALCGHAAGAYMPFLVHRLDKDTTGIMVVAKTEQAKSSLVRQFQKRAVKKVYRAVVHGVIDEQRGRIEAPIGRSPQDRKKMVVGPCATKMAVTEFSVLSRGNDYTLIEAYPVTGRTHQIRSHFSYIGHPVAGDVMYGGKKVIAGRPASRQLLHAYRLSFNHPRTGTRVSFSAEMPEDIRGHFHGQHA